MEYKPPVGGASNDPYVTGNPATGTPGSSPPGEAIEHPMREIVEVIEHAGLTPSSADLTQLRQALDKLSVRSAKAPTTSGTSTAYTAIHGITGLETGLEYVLDFDQTCGASPTLNLDSLGAKNIVYCNGFAVAEGAIQARRHRLVYDGTDFVIQDPHHITVDLSSAASDYELGVGEIARLSFSSASSIDLHIATGDDRVYELYLNENSANSSGDVEVRPNGTTYAAAFTSHDHTAKDTTRYSGVTPLDSFRISVNGRLSLDLIIQTGRQNEHSRSVRALERGVNSTPEHAMGYRSTLWTASATAWTALGTIVFPAARTGEITVMRVA